MGCANHRVHRLHDLNSASLTANSITLQNGLVNRITGNFTVKNDLNINQGIILRIRIRRTGTTQWINDLGNDTLVDALQALQLSAAPLSFRATWRRAPTLTTCFTDRQPRLQRRGQTTTSRIIR